MTGLAGTAFLAHGNSPTRGKYSKNVQGAVEFLVRCTTPTGLITGPGQDSGHADARARLRPAVPGLGLRHDHQGVAPQARSATRSARPSTLTSQGQSSAGGWTYIPGTGDEGSVTVTQVQALRAAQNAGFLVPRAVIEAAGGLPGEVPDARGGDPVLAPLRRGPAAADLGGGRGHALQRRPVRQPDRHRLPEVRLGPVPRQRRVEQGGRPRLLHPPVRVAGLLHGRRRSTGTPTSPRPATSSSPCRAATARGTATGSARSTAPRSP